MITKICPACEKEKPLTDFYKNNSRIDRVDNKCKVCKNAHVKEWYEKNKDKQREYDKKSRQKKKLNRPEKVKKEKVIVEKKPQVSYNRRITVLISDNDAREIEKKCREFDIDKTRLIRELIKQHLQSFTIIKIKKLELQPIDINNFKIIGYSDGIEK